MFTCFIPLVDILGIKPNPSVQESNFKKVGAIPCGCNTKRTEFYATHYFFSLQNRPEEWGGKYVYIIKTKERLVLASASNAPRLFYQGQKLLFRISFGAF